MFTISKQQFRWSAAAFFAAGLAVGTLPAMAAGTYKWIDEHGVVHYSDQMPADAVNKGAAVFDKEGRQIKKIDATLTPAQAKAREAEDERQRLIAKAQEDKMRRDIALTHSYTSEEEIDFARSRALLAVESQVKSAEAYMADLTKRQQELKKDKLAYGTKPAPPTLDAELTGLDEELARQDKVLAQRRSEIAAINAKYEGDKLRWREIRADQKAPAAAASNTPPPPPSKGATSSVTK
jgi:hypothetical protein